MAATLLSLNKRRFRGPRFFRKLWGIDDEEEWRGISALRESPDAGRYRNGSILAERREMLDRLAANALFSDLGVVLDDVIRPIARALERYTHVGSSLLRALEPEIAFYVGGVGLVQALRERGLPLCRPQLLPAAERRMEARACTISIWRCGSRGSSRKATSPSISSATMWRSTRTGAFTF